MLRTRVLRIDDVIHSQKQHVIVEGVLLGPLHCIMHRPIIHARSFLITSPLFLLAAVNVSIGMDPMSRLLYGSE